MKYIITVETYDNEDWNRSLETILENGICCAGMNATFSIEEAEEE